MRSTGGGLGGQRVLWRWEGPYYLLAILSAPLLSLVAGSDGIHEGL